MLNEVPSESENLNFQMYRVDAKWPGQSLYTQCYRTVWYKSLRPTGRMHRQTWTPLRFTHLDISVRVYSPFLIINWISPSPAEALEGVNRNRCCPLVLYVHQWGHMISFQSHLDLHMYIGFCQRGGNTQRRKDSSSHGEREKLQQSTQASPS